MGQYRQWLHYRDIDHRLQQQREKLSQELTWLQEKTQQAALSPPDMDNSIFAALAHFMQSHRVQSISQVVTPIRPDTLSAIEHAIPPHVIQPTSLPSTQSITEAQPNGETAHALNPRTPLPATYAPLPPLPPPPSSPPSPSAPPISAQVTSPHQNNLLPEDMNAFLDSYSQTEPQLAIPWWLERATTNAANGSLDPQSAQTNRLVQRWLERWGKQPPHQDKEEQNGNK